MRCLICSEAKIVEEVRDLPYAYKDRSTVIRNVRGEFCPICGEMILNDEEGERVSALMLGFNQQVDADELGTETSMPIEVHAA